MPEVEHHPLKPFLPKDTLLLLLGSFPPSRSKWSMEFFYPNFQNDMWRIMGIIFFKDKDHFVDIKNKKFKKEEIEDFLKKNKIGVFDTLLSIIRTQNTASDSNLEIIEATNVKELLEKIPNCIAVATMGQKATEMFSKEFSSTLPKIGESVRITLPSKEIKHFRMPSTSRRYPMKIEQKAELFYNMLNNLNLLINEKR